MAPASCEDCGTSISSEDSVCPNCGAPAKVEDEGGGGDDDESEISEAADALRGDQWTTYVLATAAGLVTAGVLVTLIIQQVFLNSRDLTERGPAYADSVEGARGYLQNHVLSQLEMKFSKDESGNVACKQTADVEKHVESAYVTKVRCESPERIIQIAVDVIHGKHSMDWDTRIEETKSK